MQPRIIAATNRDLEAAVHQGKFRQDLFFRLNVVQIKIPPLRDRKTDIPLLVNYFLEKFNGQNDTNRVISEDAMVRLVAYDWPGNVRELGKCYRTRCSSWFRSRSFTARTCPSNVKNGTMEKMPQGEELRLEDLERRAIYRALQESDGDKLKAARLLGIGKTTLYRKLKQYGGESRAAAASPSLFIRSKSLRSS